MIMGIMGFEDSNCLLENQKANLISVSKQRMIYTFEQ